MTSARTLRLALVTALLSTTLVVAVVRSPSSRAAPGDWTKVAPMGMARTGHTATVLAGYTCATVSPRPPACGMVLVAGGRVGQSNGTEAITSAAELYDPAEGTWTPLPPMATPRTGHTASFFRYAGLVVVVGGETAGGEPTASVEAFDLAASAWRTLPPMSVGRVGHSASILPGNGSDRLFVIGGTGTEGTPLLSGELLVNPISSGAWRPTPNMRVARTGHTVAPVPGPACSYWGACDLMVIGGSGDPDSSGTTEILRREPVYEDSPTNERYVAPFWQDGPDLGTARSGGHTANTVSGYLCVGSRDVPCGSVVVAGGRSGTDPAAPAINAAELFNPSTPELGFQSAGEMSSARSDHRAISLDDGRVLVVGGSASSPTTTDFYDPTRSATAWTAGPSLSTPHLSGHTVTALLTPDGQPKKRVFVAGGRTGGAQSLSADAEVFYAQTAERTWMRGPAMAVARDDHTATPLPGGKVLVSGGSADPRAEVYTHDQRSGSGRWAFSGRQLQPRAGHTATLLGNGRVLVAGGRTVADQRLATGTAELYDPTGEQWSQAAPLTYARTRHTATLLSNGKVLVVGGLGAGGSEADRIRATNAPNGPDPSTNPTVQAVEDNPAIEGAVAAVEIYDPSTGPTGSWVTQFPARFAARHGHTATLLGDGRRVLVVGGRVEDNSAITAARTPPPATDQAWIYDPDSPADGQWTEVGRTKSVHVDHTATLVAGPACEASPPAFNCGKVVIGGGSDSTTGRPNPEVFDPVAGTWTSLGNYSNAQAGHTATLLTSGYLMLAGGAIGTNPVSSLFDTTHGPGPGFLMPGARPLDNRRGHAAALLPDGKVLVTGGRVGSANAASSSTEVYDGISPPIGAASNVRISPLDDDAFGVRLRWTPPPAHRSGGSPVKGYRISYVEKQDPSSQYSNWLIRSSVVAYGEDQLSATLRDLPNVDRWMFEVAPFNEAGIGYGPRTEFLREVSLSPPMAPTDVRATPGNGSATVRWSAPPDNGTPIVGYRITIQRNDRRDASPEPRVVPALPTTAQVTGLQNGGSYVFAVQALASPTVAGAMSSFSKVVVPGIPSSEARVVAAAPRNRSALVRWEPPPDTGGGPITSYTVTARPGGATTTVGGRALHAVVPGLTNGVRYRFTMRVANEFGRGLEESQPSDASVIPEAAPPAELTDVPAAVAATEVPTVAAVYPRGGPVTGGGEALISGNGFGGATEVRFGDAPPARFRVVSDHQIVAVVPRFSGPGRVHVTVSGPAGTSSFTPDKPGVADSADSIASSYYYGEGGWEAAGFVTGAPGGAIGAVPIRDGRVLVTGVVPSTGAVVARTYDPATGWWSEAAAPTRVPTLAVPLEGGNVLALTKEAPKCTGAAVLGYGVYDRCVDPVVAQIFDATTGRWSDLATTKATAANGAAAQIGSGKVLVAGGCCDTGSPAYSDRPITAAEIFDPAAKTWTETTRMLHARIRHTLTTLSGPRCGLKCGTVLAVGGHRRPAVLGPRYGNPEPLLPPPELYDPVSRTWRSVEPMKVNRYGHTATLLADGRVLVAGGSTDRDLNPDEHYASATAEIYDPEADSWAEAPSMSRVRYGHTATLLPSGKVLVTGGYAPIMQKSGDYSYSTNVPVTTAELYNPVTEKWEPAGGEHTPGSLLAVPLPSSGGCDVSCGKVMLLGATGDVELYTPAPAITAVTPMSTELGSNDPVTITGRGFANEAEVSIGGTPARISERSHTRLVVRPSAPRHSSAPISVTTTGGEATSKDPFVFAGPPGSVRGLTATPQGTEGVQLRFLAAGSVGDADPAAQSYVVKQSRQAITADNFDDARPLCAETDGMCSYEIAHAGDPLNIDVGALTPNTTYHWGVRAKVGDVFGPLATVQATTGEVVPGLVDDLTVAPRSTTRALLSFSVTGLDGTNGPPANDYVIRFSRRPITAESFGTDRSLCDPVCSFEAIAVGQRVELPVSDLAPGTKYYFALRPVGHGGRLGPLSRVAEMSTIALAPGVVTDLLATAVSSGEVRLTFAAPGSPDADSPPAPSYVIKQSKSPITDDAAFEGARTLCAGICRFAPRHVGDELSLSVTGLAPNTTYYYAARVRDASGNLGPISNLAEVTTLAPCAPTSSAGAGQVHYGPGYNLVSVASGTTLPAPLLYGWFDQGSGKYSLHGPASAETGRGYWAWFACPAVVDLAGGASTASFPLGRYHASIVGNPSATDPATMSGHDFAATWDPAANGGTGAYRLSGFQEAIPLSVGQAAWAFSYKDTTLTVRAP